MPKFKLSWWERNWWEVEIEARDLQDARDKWNNWDDSVHDNCYETDFIDKGDVEIEEIKST